MKVRPRLTSHVNQRALCFGRRQQAFPFLLANARPLVCVFHRKPVIAVWFGPQRLQEAAKIHQLRGALRRQRPHNVGKRFFVWD